MAGLKDSGIAAEVIWLGHVASGSGSIRSVPRPTLELGFGGVDGEQHEGVSRPSCSRVAELYPRGTEITNTRQLRILSVEELDDIASDMGLSRLHPSLVGASMVLRGISDFSHVPPSSRLLFTSGASLAVDLENGPCVYPGREIETDTPGFGKLFKPAAGDRRGVTAWVERPGPVAIGDSLRLFVPDQRAWGP